MSRTLAPTLRRAAVAGLTLLALFGPAQAQYTNYMRPGTNFTSVWAANNDAMLSVIRGQQKSREMYPAGNPGTAQQANKAAPTAAAPAPPRAPLSATDFKPSATRAAAAQIAAAVADPAGRAQMTQVCRDLLAMVEATPGFRKHNLASALTLLLGVSQEVLSGQAYSDAQIRDYMQRMNDEVAAAGYFARLNVEQRTRAYDTMVITGGLIAGIAHHAAETGDQALGEQARAMARDALTTFGVKHP